MYQKHEFELEILNIWAFETGLKALKCEAKGPHEGIKVSTIAPL